MKILFTYGCIRVNEQLPIYITISKLHVLYQAEKVVYQPFEREDDKNPSCDYTVRLQICKQWYSYPHAKAHLHAH